MSKKLQKAKNTTSQSFNDIPHETIPDEEYAELLDIVKNSTDMDWQDLSCIED